MTEPVLPIFHHNPQVVKHPDGTFLLFSIGPKVFNTQLFSARSLEGPWTSHGIIINGSNPSPYIMANGTVVVAFKAIPNGLRVATALHWRGPYSVLSRPGVPQTCCTKQTARNAHDVMACCAEVLLSPRPLGHPYVEDHFLWFDRSVSRWSLLLHQYYAGGSGAVDPGGFAYSDGPSLLSEWHFAGVNHSVYSYEIELVNGSSMHADRQRPKLLFGQDGTPQYLYNGIDPGGARKPTHTFVQRIKSWTPPYDTHTSASKPKRNPVKLIVDTDIGGGGCNDVDDVVAVSVANALADNGEADLLAIIQNSAPVRCTGAISVLNHYYGRDDVPIGAYNVDTPNATLQMQDPLKYVNELVSEFQSRINSSSQAEDGVALYRRVLATQPDSSVAISSIGIHTNLAGLLKSAPDQHSPLDGKALVARKVSLLAVMGGRYPSGTGCNLGGGTSNAHNHLVSSAASSYVAANWPTKIIWSGVEVGLKVQSGGAGFQRCAVATDANPVRAAMVSYEGGANKGRFSWDPLTTLVAVRGAAAANCSECTDCDGRNVIDPNTGSNRWVSGPPSNQTYLVLHDGQAVSETLNALLCQKPKLGPAPAVWTKVTGANCYGTRDGGRTYHGGTDLEKPASASCGVMSVPACQLKCEQTEGCTGVTVQKAGGGDEYNCYRKADIHLSECDQGTTFDTYVMSVTTWKAEPGSIGCGNDCGGCVCLAADSLHGCLGSGQCYWSSLNEAKQRCGEWDACAAIHVMPFDADKFYGSAACGLKCLQGPTTDGWMRYIKHQAPAPSPTPSPAFTGVSVSGFSAGACMAQIHFLHFAGQADGLGYDGCVAYGPEYIPASAKAKIKGKGVFVESGLYDTTVPHDKVVSSSSAWDSVVGADRVKTMFDAPTGHSWLTAALGKPSSICDRSKPIQNCQGRDLAGDILKLAYAGKPGFKAPSDPHDNSGNFFWLAQDAYVPNRDTKAAGVRDRAAVFKPDACTNASACMVHVHWHGCGMAPGSGWQVHRHSGFNAWGVANNIVIIYPAANECWNSKYSCFEQNPNKDDMQCQSQQNMVQDMMRDVRANNAKLVPM